MKVMVSIEFHNIDTHLSLYSDWIDRILDLEDDLLEQGWIANAQMDGHKIVLECASEPVGDEAEIAAPVSVNEIPF